VSGELTIRAARPHEYTAIGELTARAYAPVLADADDDPYLPELLDAEARANGAELLAAVDREEQILGTVTIGRPGSAFAEIAKDDELEVRMLAVTPECARQGIGKDIMSVVHQIAEREGFSGLVLSVISTNTAAVKFYERLGYHHIAERDWFPRGDRSLVLEVFVRKVNR
jgi:ribosomal protein S18 acetylase RimI-like enzyme